MANWMDNWQMPFRTQSLLGTEYTHLYNQDKTFNHIALAQVTKVNYQYNTVDFTMLSDSASFSGEGTSDGRGSAHLPVAFGGRLANGKPFGHVQMITIGTLILVGFVDSKQSNPIVLGVYTANDVAKMLARTDLTSADDSNEDLQGETWQDFFLYPSMTYYNIDGRGNIEHTYSGHTFLYVTDMDQSGELVTDHNFEYDLLPSSSYSNGEQIEPVSPYAPTILFNHGNVTDPHRLKFYVAPNGKLRISSSDLGSESVSYFELNELGDFRIRRQNDSSLAGDPDSQDNIEIDLLATGAFRIVRNGVVFFQVDETGLTVNGLDFSGEFGDVNDKIDNLDDKIDQNIDDLRKSLQETEDYIDTSFMDGLISSQEAQRIKAYLNTVKGDEAQIDSLFNQIYSNPYLTGQDKVDLYDKYTVCNDAFNELISSINIAIYDDKATSEESSDVDVAFSDYNAKLSILSTQLEKARQFISEVLAGKAEENAKGYVDEQVQPLAFRISTTETDIININGLLATKIDTVTFQDGIDGAKAYADDLKALNDDDIADLRDSLSSTEDYVNTTFRDGIISESEANRIKGLLSHLNADKLSFDAQYNLIYNNPDIPVDEKTVLGSTKTTYDTSYQTLIDAINTAITDGKASVLEAQEVTTAFSDYGTRLSDLDKEIDHAIDIIAQVKANRALEDAKAYADAMKTDLNTAIGNVQDSLDETTQYIDGAFKDGVINSTESSKVSSYLTTLDGQYQTLNERYTNIYNNEDLPQANQTSLSYNKTDYDNSYNDLVGAINSTISDNIVTQEESDDIDTKFQTYNNFMRILDGNLTLCINLIASIRADNALNRANTYTDNEVAPINVSLENMNSSLTQTNAQIATKVSHDTFTQTVDTIKDDVNKKAVSFTDTPVPPYKPGDIWKNGDATYICILGKADGEQYAYSDWRLSGDVTGQNTALDTTNVNGTPATQITQRLSSAETNIQQTSDKVDIKADKTYVDQEITTTQQYVDQEITTTKQYADGAANTAQTNANNYTDTQLQDVNSSIDGAQQDIADLMNDVQYRVDIIASNGVLFQNGVTSTTLTANVYKGETNVTSSVPANGFIWKKYNGDGTLDSTWTNSHVGVGRVITVSQADIDSTGTFTIDINI